MFQGCKLQENNPIKFKPNEKQFVWFFTFKNPDNDSEMINACNLIAALNRACCSTKNEN